MAGEGRASRRERVRGTAGRRTESSASREPRTSSAGAPTLQRKVEKEARNAQGARRIGEAMNEPDFNVDPLGAMRAAAQRMFDSATRAPCVFMPAEIAAALDDRARPMDQPQPAPTSTIPEHLLAAFPILEFFRYAHLTSEKLREASRDFHEVAIKHAAAGMNSRHRAEVAAGLRKLLEAKDCLVRAALS